MWSHTDRASSSQISRSTAHGAHKRPGHNWKCQNQCWWQALIKLNMFPSGEGRVLEGRGGEGRLVQGGSNELSVCLHWLGGHLWLCGSDCDTTLASAAVEIHAHNQGKSNKIAHHPSNFLWFNCEAKLRWVLARNAWNLLLLTLMQRQQCNAALV